MSIIPKSKLISAVGGVACLFVVQGALAATPEIVGQIISDGNVQVTSEGLTFTVAKGQPYLVFAGDVITAADAAQSQGATQLIMDSVGTVTMASGSEIVVDRIGRRYEVEVKRGKLGYSLQDSADVRITTAQGDLVPSGQSGLLVQGVVANLGSDVMIYGQDDSAPIAFSKSDSSESMEILAGELIYSGPARDSKIPLYAQLGAPGEAAVQNPVAQNNEQDDDCILRDEQGVPILDENGNEQNDCLLGWFALGVPLAAAIIADNDDSDDSSPASPVR